MSSPERDAKTDQISPSGLAEDCIIDDIDVILVAIRRTVDPMLFKQKNKKTLYICLLKKKHTEVFSLIKNKDDIYL